MGLSFVSNQQVYPTVSSEYPQSTLLENVKKNDENSGESITRLSGTKDGGNRAVIGSRDGNSRNYAVKDSKGSGQD